MERNSGEEKCMCMSPRVRSVHYLRCKIVEAIPQRKALRNSTAQVPTLLLVSLDNVYHLALDGLIDRPVFTGVTDSVTFNHTIWCVAYKQHLLPWHGISYLVDRVASQGQSFTGGE